MLRALGFLAVVGGLFTLMMGFASLVRGELPFSIPLLLGAVVIMAIGFLLSFKRE